MDGTSTSVFICDFSFFIIIRGFFFSFAIFLLAIFFFIRDLKKKSQIKKLSRERNK